MTMRASIVLGEAWRLFRRDVAKAVLAASCVTVGAAVFVLILGVVANLDAAIGRMLRGLGRNTLVVTRQGTELQTEEERRLRNERPADARADLAFLASHVEGVAALSPRILRVGAVRAGGREIHRVFLIQAEASFGDVLDLGVESGRFFSERESREGQAVAVVGPAVADSLFPGRSALGREIAVFGKLFRVVGIFEERGALFGQDLDKWVVLPLGAGPPLPHGRTEDLVLAFAPGTDLAAAQEEATDGLRFRHGLGEEEAADFEVLNQGNLLDLFARLLRGSLAFSVLIGSIVLLVSGLSVMNTQLVSVDERIREIGVHKAVGATRYQILWIFLWESLLIVLVGGLSGVGLAWAVARAVTVLGIVQVRIHWQVFALNWAALALVGLFFGFYPALKGGRLTVVDCLRRGSA
ncbi:MAG TPA: ABC transporter permease [Thermoanaerobaculia bacterium]|nr:ABC transporter permease [Thermoanaerobaculia bacterium]